MAANFEKFFISPGFPLKFCKNHRISKNQVKSSQRYGQKLNLKTPPGLNRIKSRRYKTLCLLCKFKEAVIEIVSSVLAVFHTETNLKLFFNWHQLRNWAVHFSSNFAHDTYF